MGEARLPSGQGSRLAAALLAALLCALPAAARAHASLAKSSPAQRATLHRAPQKIELWFSERLEPRYCTLTLLDAKGKAVELGALESGGADPKRLAATVSGLTHGRYTVQYRVLSTDGHVVQGQFPFTVRP